MVSLPLRIRRFCAEDLEELFQIDQVCFPADIAFSRGELAFYFYHPKSIARVAEAAGNIVGFVLAKVESRTSARVLTLDVVPEARRRRVGTVLMKTLHRELKRRGIGMSVLEVGVMNIPAQRLYEKLQYRQIETLIGYYRGREDAHRMVREIGIEE